MASNFTKDGVDLNVCSYCHKAIDDSSRTVDHLYPKSRGGILSNKNKVPACSSCNELKGDMTVDEFQLALKAMLRLETMNYKRKTSYLKKILINIPKIKSRHARR